MNQEKTRKRSLFVILAIALAIAAPALSSAAVVINLNYEFSGAVEPSGDAPWLKATFTDVDDYTVKLELESLLHSSTEFIGNAGWSFNFDPDGDLTALSFDYQSGLEASSINTGVNFFKADGDGYFDIQFVWDDHAFGMGDFATYLIESTDPISAASFNFYSAPGGGNGSYRSAAHVQGIGVNAGGSGWIGDSSVPVPEPGTMMLLGSGLIGLAGWGRRRYQKKQA